MKKSKGKSTRPDARAWWGKNRLSCIILAAAVVVFIIVRALAATHEQPQSRGEDYAEYETAVITDILSDSTEQDPVSDNGYRGEQLLLAEIRTGQYKGETMQVSNYVGPLYGQALKEGQRAVVLISTYSDGNHTATVYEYDRAVGLAVIVGLFLLATVAVGGKVGAKSLVALAITLVCLFFIMIPLLMKGAPTLLTVFLVCAYITVVTMVILGGVTSKTICAALGTIAGTALALLFGLQVIIDLFNLLPVNFLGSLGQVSAGITLAFAIFPAVTVALQFGAAKGIITAVVTLLVRQIVETYGKIALDAEHTISLNKDGMALLAGMIIMLVFAAMDKEGNDQNSNEMLTQIFADKVARIRKYMPVLALMGGLIAAGTSMSIMAGDPISLGLLAEGDRVNAGLTALARAIGFIPLVATTAITTGVYAPAGMTFVFVIGLLIPNPFIALIAGAACICVEILLLNVIAKGLDKFPGIKRCGDNIRTAMSYVIDIALLIGGILAAQAIMPTTGLFIIVAFWCINKCSKKPLVSMAVGPLGAILVGLIANVLFLLSLYTPAA